VGNPPGKSCVVICGRLAQGQRVVTVCLPGGIERGGCREWMACGSNPPGKSCVGGDEMAYQRASPGTQHVPNAASGLQRSSKTRGAFGEPLLAGA
jgi:hypothetical protein